MVQLQIQAIGELFTVTYHMVPGQSLLLSVACLEDERTAGEDECLCICVYVIDTLFALFEDGTILKADTRTNPCTAQAEWPCDNLQS